MKETIKIMLIIFCIVVGNIIFYNFKPNTIILSNESILQNINKEIKTFDIKEQKLNINNIYIPLFSNQLNLVFQTNENIEIKVFNDIKINNQKMLLTVKDINIYKTNNNIDLNLIELNKDIKNKIEKIDLSKIIKDVHVIVNYEITSNGLKIFYYDYSLKLSEIMIWFSTILQFIALYFGSIIVFKKYKERLFHIK